MTDLLMDPGHSPGKLSKKIGQAGVRRVNNNPMYLAVGVLVMIAIVIALVAADRAAKQNMPLQVATERAGNTSVFAKEIVGDKDGGIVEPVLIAQQSATTPPVFVAMPQNLDRPPSPPESESLSASDNRLPPPSVVFDDESDRIRIAKLQLLQEAVKAKTAVNINSPRSSGSSITQQGTLQTRDEMLSRLAAVRQQTDSQASGDPTAAYQARLAQLRASGIGGQQAGSAGSAAPSILSTSSVQGQGKNYAQFAGESDRWRLNSQPEAPRSPYELRAGFVVPATLISGINSDLPGQIMAQVAQNVYDTPTGKHLLIPQGSRLVGSYSSDVAYGQSRVLVAWQRIVFPDGKAMDIGTMPAADSAGYAGLKDQVNNHYVRIFGSAFLMSGVIAAVSMSQDTGNNNNQASRQRASDALSEALGQVLGNTISQLVSKNLNIAPTLEIRPGYRFNVIVTKDMTFSKPYQSFDY